MKKYDNKLSSFPAPSPPRLPVAHFAPAATSQIESMETHTNNLIALMRAPLTNPSVLKKQRRQLFTYNVPTYFDKYPRNEATYERFIWGCATKGKMTEARRGLEDMKTHQIPRTAYHYTSLMLACVAEKDPDTALKIIDEMKQGTLCLGNMIDYNITHLWDFRWRSTCKPHI